MLNLTQLEAFIAIVDTRSFRGAAKDLNRSQPTITQQLRKLEEDLGVSLIVRDRSMSTPTVQGSKLLPLARSLLNAASRIEDLITGRRLVVGASTNIGTYLLQPFLFKYQQLKGSGVSVDLKIANNLEIADRLSGGELDLAVMEWWDQRGGFSSRLWRREKLVVIVNPDHPWAQRKTVRPELLFEQPMIGGEAGTGTATLLQKLFGKKASRMKISQTLGSTEAVKAAVKAGLGVSLVFASAVDEEVAAGSLKAIEVTGVKIGKELFVILPDQTPEQAPSRTFAELLFAK